METILKSTRFQMVAAFGMGGYRRQARHRRRLRSRAIRAALYKKAQNMSKMWWENARELRGRSVSSLKGEDLAIGPVRAAAPVSSD